MRHLLVCEAWQAVGSHVKWQQVWQRAAGAGCAVA